MFPLKRQYPRTSLSSSSSSSPVETDLLYSNAIGKFLRAAAVYPPKQDKEGFDLLDIVVVRGGLDIASGYMLEPTHINLSQVPQLTLQEKKALKRLKKQSRCHGDEGIPSKIQIPTLVNESLTRRDSHCSTLTSGSVEKHVKEILKQDDDKRVVARSNVSLIATDTWWEGVEYHRTPHSDGDDDSLDNEGQLESLVHGIFQRNLYYLLYDTRIRYHHSMDTPQRLLLAVVMGRNRGQLQIRRHDEKDTVDSLGSGTLGVHLLVFPVQTKEVGKANVVNDEDPKRQEVRQALGMEAQLSPQGPFSVCTGEEHNLQVAREWTKSSTSSSSAAPIVQQVGKLFKGRRGNHHQEKNEWPLLEQQHCC